MGAQLPRGLRPEDLVEKIYEVTLNRREVWFVTAQSPRG